MRKPVIICTLVLGVCLVFGHSVWANHCGFPGPDQVVIYQHRDRGDACAVLEVGDYPNAAAFGLPNDSISAIDVGSNVRAILYEHAGFRGRQAHYEGGLYYDALGNVDGETSSIEIFPRQGGPAATWYLGNYPSNSQTFWSDNAQGLANDGAHWFITTRSWIYKVPLSINLASSAAWLFQRGLWRQCQADTPPNVVCFMGIPTELQNIGYDHFGDPDQNSGFLFVPLEAPNEQERKPRIVVFSTIDLRPLSSFELSDIPGLGAPWLAIRPKTRTLWVSPFNLSDSDQLREYDIDWGRLGATGQLILDLPPRQVTVQDRDSVTRNLKAIQGGVFNPEGTLLYLSSGPCDSHGYVYVFAIDDATNTARLQARSENRYGPFNFETHPEITCVFGRCECSRDEGEGLDWLDVRGLNVPGIRNGQLHLIMVDINLGTDNVYLKHYADLFTFQ